METNTTTFELRFKAECLTEDITKLFNHHIIEFEIINAATKEIVASVSFDSNYGKTINIDNGTGQNPAFSIQNIQVRKNNEVKKEYIASYITELEGWQNNKHTNFTKASNSTTNVTIYFDYVDGNTPVTITPLITNISGSFNPKLRFYENNGNWNKETHLYDQFNSVSAIISNSTYEIQKGPSYNSTFTDISYVDKKDFIEFKYDTPFRIHNNNNKVIINSQLDSGSTITYIAKFNLTRNSSLPYYAKDQNYNIETEPWKAYFTVKNVNSDNYAGLQFSYINGTNNNTGIPNTYISNNNHGKQFCLSDMFNKIQTLIINDVWSSDSSYFCPYVRIKENIDGNNYDHYYYCFDNFITKNDKVTISPNNTLIETTLLNYQTVLPNIILPQTISPNIDNYISITYNYINENIEPNRANRYQYTTLEARKDIQKIDGKMSLGSWSNYNYNVGNSNYRLRFKVEGDRPVGYTCNFDVVMDGKKLAYGGFDYDNRNDYYYTISPTDYLSNKLFSNTAPNIYVYPKTSIKYVNNMYDSTNNVSLVDINVKYSVNNIISDTISITGNKTGKTGEFSYYDNANHTVIINNINTGVNKIDHITITWYDEDEQENKTRIINGDWIYSNSNNRVLISNNNLKQPITWKSPSITYTFTVVTVSPSVEPKKYAYGISINGDSLPKDFGQLSFVLDNDNYTLKQNNDLPNTNILTLDSSSVHNNQMIYLDLKEGASTVTPYVRLYNYNTNYYVKSMLLPTQYNSSSDSSNCLYIGSIKLSDYISNNISYIYPSQIKFNPIKVNYKATLNILDKKDNKIVTTINTGKVSTSQSTIISIPEEYVNVSYNVAISNISGILSDGQEFPIKRYYLNLENLTSESTSYNIYKPIKVINESGNANVSITNAYFLDKNIWKQNSVSNCVIPYSLSTTSYIYLSSYISGITFESNVSCFANVMYSDTSTEKLVLTFDNTRNIYSVTMLTSEKAVIGIKISHI